MVFQLDNDLWFPDPHLGDDDGCIAVGGDLSVRRLMLAYRHGIFPWFPFRKTDIHWFCPLQRFVIFPDEIHVSHSMRTLMNKGLYCLSINEDFEGVIHGCSVSEQRFENEYAWLGPGMIAAYTEMHRLGYAHSVEVWDGEKLVGGLSVASLSARACSRSFPMPASWLSFIWPVSLAVMAASSSTVSLRRPTCVRWADASFHTKSI